MNKNKMLIRACAEVREVPKGKATPRLRRRRKTSRRMVGYGVVR